MERILSTMLVLGLLIAQSCSKGSDQLFSAFDELHYIILFDQGNEFELLYNGLNTAKGNYSLNGDTIFLKYTENQFKEFDPNQELTRTILIDNKSKRVNSLDNKKQFCANIAIDKRKN